MSIKTEKAIFYTTWKLWKIIYNPSELIITWLTIMICLYDIYDAASVRRSLPQGWYSRLLAE